LLATHTFFFFFFLSPLPTTTMGQGSSSDKHYRIEFDFAPVDIDKEHVPAHAPPTPNPTPFLAPVPSASTKDAQLVAYIKELEARLAVFETATPISPKAVLVQTSTPELRRAWLEARKQPEAVTASTTKEV
jgi:hypothetical protein